MAFSHGSNDAQKTMGIIALALFASGTIDTFYIPIWVKLVCALAMAVGTYSRRLAHHPHARAPRIIKLDPIHGFAAETAAASVIQLATTSASRSPPPTPSRPRSWASGSTQRLSAVRWGVAGNIVTAWLLTLPAAGLVGAAVYLAGEALRSLF